VVIALSLGLGARLVYVLACRLILGLGAGAVLRLSTALGAGLAITLGAGLGAALAGILAFGAGAEVIPLPVSWLILGLAITLGATFVLRRVTRQASGSVLWLAAAPVYALAVGLVAVWLAGWASVWVSR
jgi:hypothetical protein